MKDGVPERKHPRLKQYDYSQDGVYFITVCTNGKKRILSRIVGRPAPWPPEVRLTPIGKIVEQTLKNTANVYPGVSIDHYVIMPNHIHFLLRIDGGGQRAGRPTLMTMIHGFKNVVTRKIGQKIWQNSFYEHVVRDELPTRKSDTTSTPTPPNGRRIHFTSRTFLIRCGGPAAAPTKR